MMSKELFFEMKAEQLSTLYDATFTKKDAIKTGEALVQNVLDNGQVSVLELTCNLVRLQEVILTAVTKVRKHLPTEKTELMGVTFTPTNGGNTVNYADDEIYRSIKADLDARTEQLKMAQKQDTFDAYGNQVPKVSTTPRKDSITIKF
jgi:hypothetical protein